MAERSATNHTSTVSFRQAVEADLERIVELLADDELGANRERFEHPLPRDYRAAFEAIAADPSNELVVACVGGSVVGVLQLTFIPGLSRHGSWRCLVEGVRVHRSHRSSGIGRQLLQEAVDRARARGCRLVQLTTDKRRPEALQFYERLGFEASHHGLKFELS